MLYCVTKSQEAAGEVAAWGKKGLLCTRNKTLREKIFKEFLSYYLPNVSSIFTENIVMERKDETQLNKTFLQCLPMIANCIIKHVLQNWFCVIGL